MTDQRRAELVEIVARAIMQRFNEPGDQRCLLDGLDIYRSEADMLAETVIQALTAAGVDLECWREIESAPFDPQQKFSNERLLLARGLKVFVGSRDNDVFSKKPRPHWKSEGGLGRTYDRENQPTYWRPLPLPPKDKA